MKPLTLEETRLKEQMKERCLAKGQYIDENAKAKFDMLCHLEDFEVQYWELQQENKKLKQVIDKAIELNKQVIKDTKEFYRPTKDIIYSGDTLIDIAEQNLKILKEVE